MPEQLFNNEKDLLMQVSTGDELAYRQLFNAYRGKLYSFIYRITESKETAEDTVHDVFLKIWTHREKLPDIQNFNAYLYRMAQNHAFNGFRRMATQTVIIAELERRSGYEKSDPLEKLVSKEVRRFIHESVNNLTPQQREVYKMSREEGLKQEEIARRLNISIHTVKKHLTDALNFLRKELSHNYGLDSVALYILYCMGR